MLRQLRESRLMASLVVSLLVFLAILGLRSTGILQSLELAAYDWHVRMQPTVEWDESPIVMLTISEEDIRNQGRWPIANETLATVLHLLEQHEPRAIGIDIYLDVPVPPGREDLERALSSYGNIIVSMKFPQERVPGVPPPSVLEGTQQVGFTDMMVDPGGIVRRGLFFMDDGVNVYFSLALRLAILYLLQEGITPAPDPEHPAYMMLGPTTFRPFEANDGAYVRADAGGYQFLLDYRDTPGAFPSISLTDFLAGNYDPELIEDKVVLIGVTAVSVKDEFFTPRSHRYGEAHMTYGLALHASIVSQLIRSALDGDAPVKVVSDLRESLWFLAWGVLGALAGLVTRSVWRFAFIAAAGLGALVAVSHVSFLSGLWLPLVPSILAWLASASLVTAYLVSREKRERAQLMSLFSSHLSEQLAQEIWEHRDEFTEGGHPRPQRLVATVFFSDIVGFTTVSESLDPPELMEWLDEYMTLMIPQVNDHGGVILRFIGDAILAVFGIPVPKETEEEQRQDAINTVDCALAMRDALIAHNRNLHERGLPLIGMRIGILTGPMVAGELGSAQRREYNIHGDTVNTAARIEGYDKESFEPDYLSDPCRILVGDATRELLGDGYRTDYLGDARLRGKAQVIGIYRVLGRKPREAEGSTYLERADAPDEGGTATRVARSSAK